MTTTSNESKIPAKVPFLTRVERIAGSAALFRAAREIAIVTVGIVIAFALNTWWEGRKELKQERQHLHALAIDFEQNVGQLEALTKSEERIAQASIELLKTARGMENMPPEKIRALMSGVFSSRRFEPVMGAYQALVSSAGLTLIRNDKLRGSLAEFAAVIGARYNERFGDDLYFTFIRDFAGRLQITEEVIGATPTPKAYLDLLGDPKFQEHLALRYLAEKQAGSFYGGLLRESQEILALLRQEIAR